VNTEIRKLLKTSREKKKLTQVGLSKLLGFDNPQFVSNIERGLAGVPPKHFKKLAQILDIRPERFINAYIQDEIVRVTKIVKGN
jgi:transcriptional regulator with XRE-family HTH domain